MPSQPFSFPARRWGREHSVEEKERMQSIHRHSSSKQVSSWQYEAFK
jgi:hypothetical protein